jgi:hypothetical protein
MSGQAKPVERLRSEARLAALEAAEVIRKGQDVLGRAHEVAQAIQAKVRKALPPLDKPHRPR